MLTENDIYILNFIQNRMINRHKENPNTDYMICLKRIIAKLETETRNEIETKIETKTENPYKNVLCFCGEPAVGFVADKIRLDDPVYNPLPYVKFEQGLKRFYCKDHIQQFI